MKFPFRRNKGDEIGRRDSHRLKHRVLQRALKKDGRRSFSTTTSSIDQQPIMTMSNGYGGAAGVGTSSSSMGSSCTPEGADRIYETEVNSLTTNGTPESGSLATTGSAGADDSRQTHRGRILEKRGSYGNATTQITDLQYILDPNESNPSLPSRKELKQLEKYMRKQQKTQTNISLDVTQDTADMSSQSSQISRDQTWGRRLSSLNAVFTNDESEKNHVDGEAMVLKILSLNGTATEKGKQDFMNADVLSQQEQQELEDVVRIHRVESLPASNRLPLQTTPTRQFSSSSLPTAETPTTPRTVNSSNKRSSAKLLEVVSLSNTSAKKNTQRSAKISKVEPEQETEQLDEVIRNMPGTIQICKPKSDNKITQTTTKAGSADFGATTDATEEMSSVSQGNSASESSGNYLFEYPKQKHRESHVEFSSDDESDGDDGHSFLGIDMHEPGCIQPLKMVVDDISSLFLEMFSKAGSDGNATDDRSENSNLCNGDVSKATIDEFLPCMSQESNDRVEKNRSKSSKRKSRRHRHRRHHRTSRSRSRRKRR